MKSFKDLNLSVKVFVILVPLFVMTFGITVYVNHRSQERTVLELAQSAAEAQANIIKKSLVHMMVKYQEVDDKYLAQIGQAGGEIENLQIIFRTDSLHLFEEYATDARLVKLRARQASLSPLVLAHADPVFAHGDPSWTMICDIRYHTSPMDKHDDYPLANLTSGIPLKFWGCGRLKIVLPFKAEAKCQNCHDVPEGHILGAASMEIPFGTTITAVRGTVIRSIVVYVLFALIAILIGAVIFRRFIARPVNRLVAATEIIGKGNLDHPVSQDFDKDELGKLAAAFDEMMEKLDAAQKELINRERLSTIGQMASGIIHDFRNPMSSIAATLQFLDRTQQMSDTRRRELYNSIRTSVDRMVRMTQELLDFSRGEVKLNITETNVAEFVSEIDGAVRPNLEQHKVALTVDCRYAGNLFFDKDRLQRGIINIINNAEDAMADGGSITLSALLETKFVVFRITDTGTGIPETIRDRVFDAFVTAGKAKGTGLGLAITKKIIEQHKGRIFFETEDGKGTTFVIELPVSGEGRG